MRKLYNKKFDNQEEETSNLQKRNSNFKNYKVAMSKKKLQEWEYGMGLIDD
jgi:hypothetical protein